jgi:hypothetical protein
MRIRSEHDPWEWNLDTIQESTTRSEDSVGTVRHDARYDMTRYKPRIIQYSTYSKPRTIWYDTTRYEPRTIGQKYNTYMYCKPRTVHTIHGSYGTIWYEPQECRLQIEIFYFTNREIIFYAPRFFTIRSAVRTAFPRGVIGSYFKF